MDADTEKKLAKLARKELKRLEPPAREYDDEEEMERDGWFRSAYDDD